MIGEWLPSELECPECGCADTAENSKTGAVYCGRCDTEYVTVGR